MLRRPRVIKLGHGIPLDNVLRQVGDDIIDDIFIERSSPVHYDFNISMSKVAIAARTTRVCCTP